jgi:hypothetical protein
VALRIGAEALERIYTITKDPEDGEKAEKAKVLLSEHGL